MDTPNYVLITEACRTSPKKKNLEEISPWLWAALVISKLMVLGQSFSALGKKKIDDVFFQVFDSKHFKSHGGKVMM